MGKIREIETWLLATRSRSADGGYRHMLLREDPRKWPAVLPDVRAYFRAAHQDALDYYRSLIGISLDPLETLPSKDRERFILTNLMKRSKRGSLVRYLP